MWDFPVNSNLILEDLRPGDPPFGEELDSIALSLQDPFVRNGLDLDCRAGRNRFDWLLRRVDRSPNHVLRRGFDSVRLLG